MESKVVEAALPGTKKSVFPPAEGRDEEDAMAAAVAASPAAILAFLARPMSLLRHVAHGCAGYLGGLASRLKPAAAGASACRQPQQEEGNVDAAATVVTVEETMVVEVQSRGMMPPQRPRGLKEGKGGNGGVHRK